MLNITFWTQNFISSLPRQMSFFSELENCKKMDVPQKVIELLEQDPELAKLYALWSGVGEGYTVKEHTLRVLEVFMREFLPLPKVEYLFSTFGITWQEFVFFLALHDIGKGVAVREGKGRDFKSKEFAETAPVFTRVAEMCGLDPKKCRYFLALLENDPIGQAVIKGRDAVIANAADQIRQGAYKAEVNPEEFLWVQTLFHAIDASSYPYIRKNFFASDANVAISIQNQSLSKLLGHSPEQKEILKKLADQLHCLPLYLQDIFDTHAFTAPAYVRTVSALNIPLDLDDVARQALTYRELQQMIERKRALKMQLDATTDAVYLQCKKAISDLKDAKAPFCLSRNSRTNPELKAMCEKKVLSQAQQTLQQEVACLFERDDIHNRELSDRVLDLTISFSEQLELTEALRKFENTIAYHGTNSAALALMLADRHLLLECSGYLRRTFRAPLSGEGDIGIKRYGVNDQSVSFSPRHMPEFAYEYARRISHDSIPSEEKMQTIFKRPFQVIIRLYKEEKFSLNTLKAWRQHEEADFEHMLVLYKKALLEEIGQAIDQENEEIAYQSSIKTKDSETLQIIKENLTSFQNTVQRLRELETFLNSKTMHSQEDLPPLTFKQKKIVEQFKSPIDAFIGDHTEWEKTLFRFLQARQWNSTYFNQLLDQFQPREEILQRLDHFYQKEKKHHELLAELRSYVLTESEKQFLQTLLDGKKAEKSPMPIGPFDAGKVAKIFSSLEMIDDDYMKNKFPYTSTSKFFWRMYYRTILIRKFQGVEESSISTKMLARDLELLTETYAKLKKVLAKEDAKEMLVFPDDVKLRQLVIRPFPLLLALDASLENKQWKVQRRGEVALIGSFKFGAGGINRIYTDTMENCQRLKEVLPVEMRDQIQICQMKDLQRAMWKASPLPLSNPKWLDPTKSATL